MSPFGRPIQCPTDRFDLAIHDGSHDAETVYADLAGIAPRVRRWGFICVHDGLHSYSGPGVMEAVARFFLASGMGSGGSTAVTLPYGYGLTLIQMIGAVQGEPVGRCADKPGSPHQTLALDEVWAPRARA